jgi:hypothetical protein
LLLHHALPPRDVRQREWQPRVWSLHRRSSPQVRGQVGGASSDGRCVGWTATTHPCAQLSPSLLLLSVQEAGEKFLALS